MVALHNLEQFITQPTRITARSSTLFDFLFCNTSQRVVNHGVIHLSWSDHSPVYCVLKAGVTKAPPRTIEYRSYKSFDTNAFNQDLASVAWHVVENENNIDDAVLTWNKLFSEIADAHANIKEMSRDKIREATRDRDYHHRKAVKSNSSYHWEMYRKLRNFVNEEIKSSKSKYYCELLRRVKATRLRYGKLLTRFPVIRNLPCLSV